MKRFLHLYSTLSGVCLALALMAFAPALFAQSAAQNGNGGNGNGDNGSGDRDNAAGAVYVSSNDFHAGKNEVVIFRRGADGALTPAGRVRTGGRGTGGLLENQGAVTLSKDGEWLFVVNPGSDNLSVFRVGADGSLALVDRVPSGGDRPVSVAVTQNLVYVVNAGSSGNIAGFRVDPNGKLAQIPGSTRPLSTTAFQTCQPPVVDLGDKDAQCSDAGPTTIGFNPDGSVLVVTERLTSRIDTWEIDDRGLATSTGVFQQPVNSTPFGFAFADRGRLVVADSFLDRPGLGAASSFLLSDLGTLTDRTITLGNGNASSCWAVITNDGRFAFITQPVSHSITSYAIQPNGSLTLLNPSAAQLPGGDPRDQHLSTNGRFLFVLNNRAGTVSSFSVQGDGGLKLLSLDAGKVPSGSTGLAAR